MAQRVVLHVGTMKSGTSTLQASIFAQRENLSAAGVLVPGQRWEDQVTAVLGMVNQKPKEARWGELCAEMAEHPHDAVVSMEFLGPVADDVAKRLLAPLAPAEVEVVITVRDLNRTLPSMWQETIQNGRTWHWEDYLADAERLAPGKKRGTMDTETPGGTFWRQQHVVRMAGDWAKRIGADSVSVVTLPHPGADRSLLIRRFAEATGLPLDPHFEVPQLNSGLGLASTLMLRQVNEELAARGLQFPKGRRIRKKVLAKRTLAARAKSEPRLAMPVPDWVRTQSALNQAGLVDLGIRLVGDLADLDPVPVEGIEPEDVDQAEIAQAAIAGLVGVIAQRIEQVSRKK